MSNYCETFQTFLGWSIVAVFYSTDQDHVDGLATFQNRAAELNIEVIGTIAVVPRAISTTATTAILKAQFNALLLLDAEIFVLYVNDTGMNMMYI